MFELIGGFGAFLWMLGLLATICLGGLVPFFVWRIAHHLKIIGRQFERLNSVLEHNAAMAAPPVPQRQFTPAATSDNRTATARPGALGI